MILGGHHDHGHHIPSVGHHERHHNHKRSLNQAVEAAKPINAVGNGILSTDDQYWSGLHEKFVPDVELHSMIGISLSLGFIFMLLVDHLCGGGHSHGTSGKYKYNLVDYLCGEGHSHGSSDKYKYNLVYNDIFRRV